MISVKNNVASLRSQRSMEKSQAALRKVMEQLAAGHRIRNAADDAAGLAIATDLGSEMSSLRQASYNTHSATSTLQTAESGMSDITDTLHRMRELSMQSSSGNYSDEQRGYMQAEMGELQAELDRISGSTEYNGTSLLDGSLDSDYQVGTEAGDHLNVQLNQSFDAGGLGVANADVDVSTQSGAQSSLAAIDAALETVSSNRATVGATQNRLDVVSNNISEQYISTTENKSRILDLDFAEGVSQLIKTQILNQSNAAMLTQANSYPQIALSLLAN